ILWTVALLSPGLANAQTQLVLLSSSAAQQMSRVLMAIVIGGTPVLITSVTLKEGHDSVPSRLIGSTTTARSNSDRTIRATRRRRPAFSPSRSRTNIDPLPFPSLPPPLRGVFFARAVISFP